ncbi:MAG: excinuclease ABC subunit UvrC [Clostridia bacterium]|nr:excinuclease ABC subunit UvrC [Clostridia bacterium]
MDVIEEKLKLLPESPGCYVMMDAEGTVIYVGKAKVLKNRVRQYFQHGPKNEKTTKLVANIADFSYVITNTEIDALSLENNLIKRYKPKYNILLKDDKQYPYLRVDLSEDFPTFTVVRKIKKDGAKYFGPFMGGVPVADVLEIIYLCYGVRRCGGKLDGEHPKRECLNYHIKRCPAPCAGYVSPKEYRENVYLAIDFLSGNDNSAEKILTDKMNRFAENEEYELAMSCRDKLRMLARIKQKRITSLNRFVNADVIGITGNGIYQVVTVLVTRCGRMQGAKYFTLETGMETDEEAACDFLMQYYRDETGLPDQVILNVECKEAPYIEQILKSQTGKRVEITTPKQGAMRELALMAEKNSIEYLEKSVSRIKHKDDMTVIACERLKEILKLKKYPKRMECYDISHISGTDKVGSMVVFTDGEPDRDSYRRFRIKTVEGNNDFACLQEVLRRRLSKLGTEEEEHFARPDLIIIDGGKGQLSSVKEIFDEMGCDIDLISLAKKEEEIYTLYDEYPVALDHRDYVLKLLQRIRDEAHRFAITYHRTIRSKRMLSSALDAIDGIGEKRRKSLVKRFGTVEEIKRATVEELMDVDSIGRKQAENIKRYFEDEPQ